MYRLCKYSVGGWVETKENQGSAQAGEEARMWKRIGKTPFMSFDQSQIPSSHGGDDEVR
jgi:hypothetical protein